MCESVAAQDDVRNIIERARNLKRSSTLPQVQAQTGSDENGLDPLSCQWLRQCVC